MLTAVGLLIAFIGIWVDVLDNQNRYILPLLISGILVLAVSSAIAQEHHHPPQDQTSDSHKFRKAAIFRSALK